MTKKAATLKNLQVRVNKDGTLSRKSLEDVQGLVKPNPLERLIPQVRGKDVVLVGSFIGLTVAYRYTLIDLLSPIFSTVAVATAAEVLSPVAIATAMFDVEKQGIKEQKEWYEKEIEKAEADIARVEKLLSEGRIMPADVLIPGGRIGEPDVSPPGVRVAVSETERARGEAFIASRREFIAFARANMGDDALLMKENIKVINAKKWAVAMGLAGVTIYIMQSHTVSDFIEMIPGQ